MDVLVCVKRVPAFGAKVPLQGDGTVDTRHLGFTLGPHEECAVEEAVRLVSAHGGTATVLAVGPPETEEQVRYALAMGADRGVLVDTGRDDTDPQATAEAIVRAVADLADGAGVPDGDAPRVPFDLLLFGQSSADAGHGQVGIRVARALGLPAVGGIKGIEVPDGAGTVRLRRPVDDGVEVCEAPLPAAVAVKEGLNLPRYPTMPGRLRARKATLHTVPADPAPGGLRTLGLRQPAEDGAETVVLGQGADAAPAVVDVFERIGVV